MATKIDKADAAAVARQLRDMRATLPTGQQHALDAIVGAVKGGDVRGFSGEDVILVDTLNEIYMGDNQHDSSASETSATSV
jgi:hypothetical protein